jgi:hypothetical protein
MEREDDGENCYESFFNPLPRDYSPLCGNS